MGGVLGGALRSTGKAALDRPEVGFALLSVAAVSAVLAARGIKRSGTGRLDTQDLVSNEELVRLPDGRHVAIASHADPHG